MSWREILEVAAIAIAAAGGAAGVVFGAARARADWLAGTKAVHEDDRAEYQAVLDLRDEMIAALKDAHEEVREQLRKALERERAWTKERTDYRRRLGAVEDAYCSIVLAVVSAGICAKASSCEDYVAPGDRRNGDSSV